MAKPSLAILVFPWSAVWPGQPPGVSINRDKTKALIMPKVT